MYMQIAALCQRHDKIEVFLVYKGKQHVGCVRYSVQRKLLKDLSFHLDCLECSLRDDKLARHELHRDDFPQGAQRSGLDEAKTTAANDAIEIKLLNVLLHVN